MVYVYLRYMCEDTGDLQSDFLSSMCGHVHETILHRHVDMNVLEHDNMYAPMGSNICKFESMAMSTHTYVDAYMNLLAHPLSQCGSCLLLVCGL